MSEEQDKQDLVFTRTCPPPTSNTKSPGWKRSPSHERDRH